MTGLLIDGAVDWLASTVLAIITMLWGLLAQTAFTTPDVTTLPQVTTIAGTSLMIVNGVFVLAIIAAGIVVMVRETVQSRYGVAELVPRLVLGFTAANFAVPLCRQLVVLANAVTQALTGDGVASADSFGQMQRVVLDAMRDPANALLTVVIGLLIGVLTGMLLVTWLVRLGVLILLVGVSPVALACHATPFTDPAARLWWRALLGTLATVVLQSLALHITMAIFLNPDANVAALGIPHDPTGTVNLLIVACLLWTIIKIPGMMRRYVTRGGGQHNAAGLIVRMVFVQRLTRLLRVPSRGPRGAVGAAGALGGGGGRAVGGQPSAATTLVAHWRPRMPQPTPAAPAASPLSRSGGSGAGLPPGRPVVAPGGGPARLSPAGLSRVVAGTNPATVMPQRRPWRTVPGATPSGTGWPDPPGSRARTPAGARPSGTGWVARPAAPKPPVRHPRGGTSPAAGGTHGG